MPKAEEALPEAGMSRSVSIALDAHDETAPAGAAARRPSSRQVQRLHSTGSRRGPRTVSRTGSGGSRPGTGASSLSVTKSAMSEDQQIAEQAKQAAMELKFESKADALQNGLVHPDWQMRRAAAMEMPLHCERRPVEQFVVLEYVKLCKDSVLEVRKTALENMAALVERGDRVAIRAVLARMWGDNSWAVRLASIHAIEKIAHVGDEQVLMGLVARITDPEAARGGRFWVRAAALDAALRMSGSEKGLVMVMNRLENESWEARQQSLQCMLLGAKKIPCRIDDDQDPRAPLQKGYRSPPKPKHMAQDQDALRDVDLDNEGFQPYDVVEARRLMNGYEVSTHQSEMIPRVLVPTWEQPNNMGQPLHERTHKWVRKYRFTMQATGLDETYCSELSGRHYKETARAMYLQLKGAGGGPPLLAKQPKSNEKLTEHQIAPNLTVIAARDPALAAALDEMKRAEMEAGSRPDTGTIERGVSSHDADEEPETMKRNIRNGQAMGEIGARDPRLRVREGEEVAAAGPAHVSEAEAKREAEHQKLVQERQASLRSLRRRKSLKCRGSYFHRASTATGEGSASDVPREAFSSFGIRARPESPCEPIPVREALPMITLGSFSAKTLCKADAGGRR